MSPLALNLVQVVRPHDAAANRVSPGAVHSRIKGINGKPLMAAVLGCEVGLSSLG